MTASVQSASPEVVPQQLRSVGPPDATRDDFSIIVRSLDDDDLMIVEGEIDLVTAPALHRVLHQLLAAGRRHVSVDFGAVTFVDATALTFLVAAGRDLALIDGSLTILGDNPLLARLLAVTKLTGLMDN